MSPISIIFNEAEHVFHICVSNVVGRRHSDTQRT